MGQKHLHIHSGKDIVVQLHFPRRRNRLFWKPKRYDSLADVDLEQPVRQRHCLAQGRALLKDPNEIEIEFGLTANPGGDELDLAVGMLFPDYTMPRKLEVEDGRAIAVLNPHEPIDLESREGRLVIFFEEIEQPVEA